MKKLDFATIKSYEDFRTLAKDDGLSKYERIGFPDSFREGKEAAIFADICLKLPSLAVRQKIVLDIGPGCSDIPRLLVQMCETHGHTLVLADSEEMLSHLPDTACVQKFPGFFPATKDAIVKAVGGVDVILCYSVFHYIYADTDYMAFIDACITLMNDGGEMLIGDIPNLDKRNRFFSSPNGVAFHKRYMNTNEPPTIMPNTPELNAIDEKVLGGIIEHVRAKGCDAYLVPQPEELPMANRRDDLLIRKP